MIHCLKLPSALIRLRPWHSWLQCFGFPLLGFWQPLQTLHTGPEVSVGRVRHVFVDSADFYIRCIYYELKALHCWEMLTETVQAKGTQRTFEEVVTVVLVVLLVWILVVDANYRMVTSRGRLQGEHVHCLPHPSDILRPCWTLD